MQADRLHPDLLAGQRIDHVDVRAEIAEHQHLALRARQLAVARARAQRHLVFVDPAHARRSVDVDREQPRRIRHRQEQRLADDRRLRAHRSRFREGERPRELELAHVLRAQARLLCRQVTMILLVEAEADDARLRAEVNLAAARRAHRLCDPVVARYFAADQEVDDVRALLRTQRRSLRLHLALRERVADRLVAHRLERVERRRACRLGIVVACGARAIVDRLARMIGGLHAHRGLCRSHRLRIADRGCFRRRARRLRGRLRLRACAEQQGSEEYVPGSGDHSSVSPAESVALLQASAGVLTNKNCRRWMR